MLKLDTPEIDPVRFYNICISRSTPASKKERLENSKECVEASCTNYRQKAEAGELFEYRRVGGAEATDVELYKVYDSGTRKNGPGRDTYDALILSAPRGQCVLCFQRDADALDHYLPRSAYQELSVAPDNLIPVCSKCNGRAAKGTHVPSEYTDQLLHPYFDDFTEERWLFAEAFLVTGETTITLRIETPEGWSEESEERLKFHFEKLGLWKLYAVNAASLVQTIIDTLDAANLTNDFAVRQFLEQLGQKFHRRRPNCWEAAVYFALADFDPFIESVTNN
ncbi:MAG TPA: hypothetical protein DCS30_06385 [Rhizobiales bacterium]|nr:hypothetical protein [Hyphomicrobiales bacterium]